MEVESFFIDDHQKGKNFQVQYYKFQFQHDKIFAIYEEILRDCPVNKIFDTFCKYVADNIEPVGWTGIWIPDGEIDGMRYIVRVVSVLETLEASVVIINKLTANNNPIEMEDNVNGDERIISLKELFVIQNDDQEETFQRTAFIIEVVRFFYNYLWRPWDDLDDNHQGEGFFVNRLVKRMDLIFAMKNNLIPERLVLRNDKILLESASIKKRMDKIINGSDSKDDEYLKEIEGFEYTKLKCQLEDYQREMKIIEDRNLRIMYDTIIPECELDNVNEPLDQVKKTLHFVSPSPINFETLTTKIHSLKEADAMKMPLKLHNSFLKALRSSKSGDSIYLMSGTYTQSFVWIENDIEIYGLDGDVELLTSYDCEIFLLVNIPGKLKMSNIKFKANTQIDQLILIKSGQLILENCILDCNQVAEEAFVELKDAQTTELNNTKIINQSKSK